MNFVSGAIIGAIMFGLGYKCRDKFKTDTTKVTVEIIDKTVEQLNKVKSKLQTEEKVQEVKTEVVDVTPENKD